MTTSERPTPQRRLIDIGIVAILAAGALLLLRFASLRLFPEQQDEVGPEGGVSREPISVVPTTTMPTQPTPDRTIVARFKISIVPTDATPAVGERVTLVVRSEQALDHDLRLIAVAPGQPVFRVVATITGDTSRPVPNVDRHGFEIRLARIAPSRWRGRARFSRAGRWRLVVPNWAPVGVVVPNGAASLTLPVH